MQVEIQVQVPTAVNIGLTRAVFVQVLKSKNSVTMVRVNFASSDRDKYLMGRWLQTYAGASIPWGNEAEIFIIPILGGRKIF